MAAPSALRTWHDPPGKSAVQLPDFPSHCLTGQVETISWAWGVCLGSMHYCIVLEYLSVSSMSQTALCGQLCIRSFLSDLIWDKQYCTVWGCALHDLDDLMHTGLPSHQHAASSAWLSWVLQGLQSDGWVWVYVNSSQATRCTSLCSAWSLPLPLCFSWLLTWRPQHSCGCRDGSSAPIQLLALRASATQKYTHWSLWELVQTCGHSKTWLSEPWSLASSLWPVVSLLASYQIPYPTCQQVWLEIFLEITQPCTDKGLMFPKETCTHTMKTYSSLSSCWHPKQMDLLPHGLTPAAALTLPCESCTPAPHLFCKDVWWQQLPWNPPTPGLWMGFPLLIALGEAISRCSPRNG